MKASLRGHDFETQVQMLAPDGPNARDDAAVTAHAAAGLGGGGGKLPHLGQIQRSFGGYDISLVQAHTDAAAQHATTAMGARAYASGDHVVLGQGGTDLHTVAHEAAHVVQQKAGVSLSGGVGKAGDAHERHADAVADRVVAGQSAEDLLSQYGGGGAGAGSGGGVQLKEDEEAPGDVAAAKDGGKEDTRAVGGQAASVAACTRSGDDDTHIAIVESTAQAALAYALQVKSESTRGVAALEDMAKQASRLNTAGAKSRSAIRDANEAARNQELMNAISGLGHVLGAVAGGGRLIVSAFKSGAVLESPKVLGQLEKLEALSGHMKNAFGIRSAVAAYEKSNGDGPANATIGALQAVDRRNDVQDDVMIDIGVKAAVTSFDLAKEFASKTKNEIDRGVQSAGKVSDSSDARLKEAIRKLGTASETISDVALRIQRAMPILAAHRAGATHVAAAGSKSRSLLDWVMADHARTRALTLHRLQWKALVIPSDSKGHYLIDSDAMYCVQALTPEADTVLKLNAFVQLAGGMFGVTNDVGQTLAGLIPPKIADRNINKVYFRGQPYDEKVSLASYMSDPDEVVRNLSHRFAMFHR